jgi:hypothetical protein
MPPRQEESAVKMTVAKTCTSQGMILLLEY